MKRLIFTGILLILAVPLCAQVDSLSADAARGAPYARFVRENGFSIGGYYRFYGINRTLESGFRVLPSNEFASTPPFILGVGDIYRDPPIMLMTASIRPGGGAAINMDYALYSNFTNSNGSVPYNLNLGISLYGTVPLERATVGFQLGGINWVDVSDMVFSSFVGYNRFSLFERWAWEGIYQATERAEFYIENGDISRESRWARQAYKGMLFDLTDLPMGLSARVMYGKTPATATFGRPLPSTSYGGRLRKAIKGGYVGANTMNYLIFTDSLAIDKAGISLHTLNGSWQNDFMSIAFEGGVGRLFSVAQDGDYGEAVRLNLGFKEIAPRLRGDIDLFYIAPEFVNYYGNFLSSNTQISTDGQSQVVTGGGGASTFAGSITDVGQVLNNRKGVSMNLFYDIKNTHLNVGTMVSQELERVTNRLSFGHKINGLALSRFAPFTNGIGPYGRWNSFFRGVAEDIFITDTDSTGLPPSKLGFNTVQWQVKQRIPHQKHPLYIVYTGMSGNVAEGWSFLPSQSDKNYLVSLYNELDIITSVTSWMDVCIGLGVERIKGNQQTNNIYYVDDAGNLQGASVSSDPTLTFDDYGLDGVPIAGSNYAGTTTAAAGQVDQRSTSLGLGVDIALTEQSGLYIRHKRYTQSDVNFTADDIIGTETTIELKIFF